AQTLLKLKYLSVTEIAEICGFSDVYYFCKVFKSKVGLSPGKIKKTAESSPATRETT
ncbi:MAG: AraC family transcriptional regulator, partial [Clostridia bacterium]|nr:AraC family transcriptional regulator [Clostridia bacterium]